jgi:hypothetical protein
MKQTAVEFIIEQLDCLNRERKENLIDAESYFKYKKALTEQANEMFKQQIIDACYYGHLKGWVAKEFWLSPNCKYSEVQTSKELLEIFKEEEKEL